MRDNDTTLKRVLRVLDEGKTQAEVDAGMKKKGYKYKVIFIERDGKPADLDPVYAKQLIGKDGIGEMVRFIGINKKFIVETL